MKSRTVADSQKKIIKLATNFANAKARELLDDDALVKRLSILSNANKASLRSSWNPFVPDTTSPSGFGLKIRYPDSLVLEDEGLIDLMHEIGVEAVAEAMVARHRDFATTLVRDIFSAEPFYQPELAKTRPFKKR